MIRAYLYSLGHLISNSAKRDDDIVFRNGINWRNILIFLSIFGSQVPWPFIDKRLRARQAMVYASENVSSFYECS